MIGGSRLLKIALPITLLLLGLFVYEYGYLKIKSEEAELTDATTVKRKTLEKYASLISQKPVLEKTLQELQEKRKAEKRRFFEGQTPALASAALQNTVKSMITAKGGAVSSERVEKPETFGRLKVVSVTIEATLPGTKELTETLYAIETHTPYIVIREIDVRVKNFQASRELTVKLTVAALAGGI